MNPVIAAAGFARLEPDDHGGVVAASVQALACPDLLEGLATVGLLAPEGSTWRFGQGREHPVAVVLALVAAAVLAGKRSLSAIAGWVAEVTDDVLTGLYQRAGAVVRSGHRLRRPSRSGIRRVLITADAVRVDAVIGSWLAAMAELADAHAAHDDDAEQTRAAVVGVAVDGKYLRGARHPTTGEHVITMAAATHDRSLVLAQLQIDVKSNEIPAFVPLMEAVTAAGIDLTGQVITADALHCQRAHAAWLTSHGLHYVFTAKGNQPGIYAAIDALTWDDVPIGHESVDIGHGRNTRRTIRTLPAPAGLDLPGAAQVALIEREVRDPKTLTLTSAVAALIVTSLPAHRASPRQIADLVRRHWSIESMHWIRDVVFAEDANRTRTASAPRVLASLRNLAIGAIKLHGHRGVTETMNWAANHVHRPLEVLHMC